MSESIIERYQREMMEMYRKASVQHVSEEPVQDMDKEIAETIEGTIEGTEEIAEETVPEENEEATENTEYEKSEHTDDIPSVCPLCGGKIAFCSFEIKGADSTRPIEYAQVTLHREDGFFIRVLADEEGRTCEFPLCSEMPWKVSVTAEGYIPVNGAVISPSSGESLSVPVELYESLSLRDVFAQHHEPFDIT